ncbi:MAG: 30S ribosome-binding factor RbfA [Nitriliruptoraceae bacterium]
MVRKRNPRIDSLVRSALADIIETEISDPRLAFVTITEVEVTPDHDVAIIYYTSLDPTVVSGNAPSRGDRVADADEVAAGLESALPRLRALLVRRVDLRSAPDLRFRRDPTVEHSARIESLLRGLDRDGD